MSWLFGLSGKLAAIGGAILAGLAIVWRILAMQKKAGVDEEKARGAAAREKARAEQLDRIQAAKEAGRAARAGPADGVPDPFDRDNRR